jgi:GAF domain-containing protein
VDADDDLGVSLVNLSRLLTGNESLEATLTRVAEYAVRAIPGADGVGLTVLEADRPNTMVASAPFVREVDAVQYGLGEGPCITAVAERRVVRSGSLGGATAWPRFGPRIGRLGVHSVLSLPLLLPDAVVGALNVYAHPKDAFDDRATELGQLFATPAATSVHNALVLERSRRLVGQLNDALTNRATIDQALGIVMSRTGVSTEEAFDRLRAISQTEHLKVAEVARRIVVEAVRRAQSRHRDR